MKNTLIADTGFWIALIDKRDHYHKLANQFLSGCDKRLITTWPVITETSYMLLSRQNVEASARFLDMGANDFFSVHNLNQSNMSQASSLMLKYSNLPMDLADASLVILAGEIGHGQILSTDQRDFDTYRWKNHKPFENLLLSG